MPHVPTIAEIDREIAELEGVTDGDLIWSSVHVTKEFGLCEVQVLLSPEQAAGLLRLGITARLAQLEQQRADLGLRRSEGPTGNKTIENAAKARECYREALRQVAKRERLTQAELAPVISNVSGANDYTDGIPARLDHNQP